MMDRSGTPRLSSDGQIDVIGQDKTGKDKKMQGQRRKKKNKRTGKDKKIRGQTGQKKKQGGQKRNRTGKEVTVKDKKKHELILYEFTRQVMTAKGQTGNNKKTI